MTNEKEKVLTRFQQSSIVLVYKYLKNPTKIKNSITSQKRNKIFPVCLIVKSFTLKGFLKNYSF